MRQRLFYILILCLFFAIDLQAQCSMCGTAVESNRQNGGAIAKALNSGILYLMAFPFMALVVIGFLAYKAKQQSE